MNLKEVILKRNDVHFIALEIEEIQGFSIKCNIAKNQSGNYMYKNPELTIEDLEGVDFSDITKIEFFTTEDEFRGCAINISKDTIRQKVGTNKVYNELNNALITAYKEIVKMYSKKENKYSNPLRCTSGVFVLLIFPIMGIVSAILNSDQENALFGVVMFGSLALFFIIGWIIAIIDCKNDYLKYKELREKNEVVLNNLTN